MNDAETDEKMGYFFLDLYPRDGKFGHAAIFPLQPSCVRSNGERQVRDFLVDYWLFRSWQLDIFLWITYCFFRAFVRACSHGAFLAAAATARFSPPCVNDAIHFCLSSRQPTKWFHKQTLNNRQRISNRVVETSLCEQALKLYRI